MTSRSSVERFLARKTLALAGASRGGKKFGNTILKELIKKEYELSLIHPEATEISGLRCHPSVSDLPGHIDRLVIVVPPEQTERIVQEAVGSRIRNIWMQQGSESAHAIELCQENGINVVHGQCILMFAQPTGVHKFHRWLWGLIGRLPTHQA